MAAAKQCGTPWLPRIGLPKTPEAWLADRQEPSETLSLSLIASLEAGSRRIREVIAEAQVRTGQWPRHVTVIIGPEGDFTSEEYGLFRQQGAQPVTLGNLVLRADTAAVAAVAILSSELSGRGY